MRWTSLSLNAKQDFFINAYIKRYKEMFLVPVCVGKKDTPREREPNNTPNAEEESGRGVQRNEKNSRERWTTCVAE